MAEVISLSPRRIEKHSKKIAYQNGSLDVDFNDIERFCATDEEGNYKLTLDDRIALGKKSELQIREIFWRYGLRQIPKTWAELEGNWNYCRLLALYMISLTPDEPEAVIKSQLARHNKRTPGLGDLLRLLMNNDLDAVHLIHIEKSAFHENAKNPKFVK